MARLDGKSEPAVRVLVCGGHLDPAVLALALEAAAAWRGAQLLTLPGSHLARPISSWAREHGVDCMECSNGSEGVDLADLVLVLPGNRLRSRRIIRQAQTNGALILSIAKLLELALAARN
jgi:hypothetical protein